MFECKCIECGDKFEAKTMFAKVCSQRCVMRRYRKTAKGKANVLAFNKRVKRRDIAKVCEVCGDDFVTARTDQLQCGKASCKKKSLVLGVKRHGDKYPDRRKARANFSKNVQRGYIEKRPCCICGDIESEGHHFDYSRQRDVIWLCREHHQKLHHGGLAEAI